MAWKPSARYLERLREYYYFAKSNTGCDFKMVNSKMPINGIMPISLPRTQPTGISAHEALFKWESTGELVDCCEPRRLYRLMAGKAWRDWHIEEWSSGVVEGIQPIFELRASGVPESLLLSVKKAVDAKYAKKFS